MYRFCLFDKADITTVVQWHCSLILPFQAQITLGAKWTHLLVWFFAVDITWCTIVIFGVSFELFLKDTSLLLDAINITVMILLLFALHSLRKNKSLKWMDRQGKQFYPFSFFLSLLSWGKLLRERVCSLTKFLYPLTLLHSEGPKLYRVLVFQSALGLRWPFRVQ